MRDVLLATTVLKVLLNQHHALLEHSAHGKCQDLRTDVLSAIEEHTTTKKELPDVHNAVLEITVKVDPILLFLALKELSHLIPMPGVRTCAENVMQDIMEMKKVWPGANHVLRAPTVRQELKNLPPVLMDTLLLLTLALKINADLRLRLGNIELR